MFLLDSSNIPFIYILFYTAEYMLPLSNRKIFIVVLFYYFKMTNYESISKRVTRIEENISQIKLMCEHIIWLFGEQRHFVKRYNGFNNHRNGKNNYNEH